MLQAHERTAHACRASLELHRPPMTQPAPRASPSGRACTLNHTPLPDPEGMRLPLPLPISAPNVHLVRVALLLSLPVARHSQSATDAALPSTPANHTWPETRTVPQSCPPQTLRPPGPVNGGMRWSDTCRIIVRLSIDAGGKVRRVPHWPWPRLSIGRRQTRRALVAFQKTRTGAYGSHGSCQVGLSNDDLPARPLRQPLQGLEPLSSDSGPLNRHLPGRWKIAMEKIRGLQYTRLPMTALCRPK